MSSKKTNQSSLTPADWQRTVSISTKSIGPKVKRLSKQEKELLLQSGREGLQQYLQSHHDLLQK